MSSPAVIQLRLPRSIKAGVERAAKRDGTSMNQLIATAVAEKLSALETADFFEERAARADYDRFDRLMNRTGGANRRVKAMNSLPAGRERACRPDPASHFSAFLQPARYATVACKGRGA